MRGIIESTDRGISVFIPRAEVDPVRFEQMLRPLRLEAAVSASRMTDENMKANWWAAIDLLDRQRDPTPT